MRTYRLEIRLIQLSIILTAIVMVFGIVTAWRTAEADPAPNSGEANPPSQNEGTQPGTEPEPSEEEPLNTKIVCLGDSYTYGYPGEPGDAWPARIQELLTVEVVNSGEVYQNADDLLERFEEDVLSHEPGRVVIFAGVGDALRGIPLGEYQENLKALVEKAESNHITPILALPIPYPGVNDLINEYREWEKSYAKEKDILVLDFKEVLFDEEGDILREYSDDGKYPNKDGYEAMGDYAARVLQ